MVKIKTDKIDWIKTLNNANQIQETIKQEKTRFLKKFLNIEKINSNTYIVFNKYKSYSINIEEEKIKNPPFLKIRLTDFPIWFDGFKYLIKIQNYKPEYSEETTQEEKNSVLEKLSYVDIMLLEKIKNLWNGEIVVFKKVMDNLKEYIVCIKTENDYLLITELKEVNG